MLGNNNPPLGNTVWIKLAFKGVKRARETVKVAVVEKGEDEAGRGHRGPADPGGQVDPGLDPLLGLLGPARVLRRVVLQHLYSNILAMNTGFSLVQICALSFTFSLRSI